MGDLKTIYQVNNFPSTTADKSAYLADQEVVSCYAYDQYSYVTLQSNSHYLVEGYNGASYATVSFGVIYTDSDVSSSTPLTAFGYNNTSTTMSTNTAVKLQLYPQGSTWRVRVYNGTSTNPTTSTSTYSLIFRRLYI